MRRRLRTLAAALAGLPLAAGVATAHVKYVTPGSDPVAVGEFLVAALSDPFNLLVLAAGALGLAGVLGAYLVVRPARHDVAAFRAVMREYRDLLPWLLRLSLGLPLVGAGFAGYFFTPVVAPSNPVFVRLFGITLGFLVLFGLATRLTAAVGLVAYVGGVVLEPALLLAFEFLPGFLALVLVGGGRPSADEVISRVASDDRTLYSRLDPFYRSLAVPVSERTEGARRFVPVVLRVGTGLAFLYLGVAQKLMNPGDSLAVVAKYDLTAVVPVAPELWVVGAGLTEALVGVALVLGLFTRGFSLLTFGLLTSTLFGLPDDPVLAHISLFGLVSALLITGSGPLSVDRWLSTTTGEPDGREGTPAD